MDDALHRPGARRVRDRRGADRDFNPVDPTGTPACSEIRLRNRDDKSGRPTAEAWSVGGASSGGEDGGERVVVLLRG